MKAPWPPGTTPANPLGAASSSLAAPLCVSLSPSVSLCPPPSLSLRLYLPCLPLSVSLNQTKQHDVT